MPTPMKVVKTIIVRPTYVRGRRLHGRENRGDIVVVRRISIHSAILLRVPTIS